jgi:hypothetical protein
LIKAVDWRYESGIVGYLLVTALEFRVIEWSSARIAARYEVPFAEFEIRIFL